MPLPKLPKGRNRQAFGDHHCSLGQEKSRKTTKVAAANGRSAFVEEDFFYDRQRVQSSSTVLADVHRTPTVLHRKSGRSYTKVCGIQWLRNCAHILRPSKERGCVKAKARASAIAAGCDRWQSRIPGDPCLRREPLGPFSGF